MHALTGCDATSKVATEASGPQAAIEEGQKLLFDFGRGELLQKMIAMAEYFFTKCASHATEFQEFDELGHHVYHYLRLHASFVNSITLDPSQYGFYHDEDGKLYPLSLDKFFGPEYFPEPSNCLKWTIGSVCAFRLKNIACCIFCKYGSSEQCQNLQTDITSKHFFHCTYLNYFVYVHVYIYLLNLVFIHEDA